MKNLSFILLFLTLYSCQGKGTATSNSTDAPKKAQDYSKLDTATFAGGCFWCVEASFEQIKGVAEAVSGYAGGDAKDANYQLVSSGRTKHAEAVQIYYDPTVITYETLLEIFFTAHDPTQLNRQGPDVGPQYRSAVFYHSAEQLAQAEQKIAELKPEFSGRIVTELNPYETFYPAEDYHQDYEKNHPFDRYILNVSKPKIEKVKKRFREIVKEEYLD